MSAHPESAVWVVARFPTLGASRFLLAPRTPVWSAGSACGVRGHNVGRMAVQGDPGAVVAHRGSRVGVRGGLLDVTERNTRVQGSRDERVPEGMGSNWLCDPCSPGDTADDPAGPVTVETPTVTCDANGAAVTFADS